MEWFDKIKAGGECAKWVNNCAEDGGWAQGGSKQVEKLDKKNDVNRVLPPLQRYAAMATQRWFENCCSVFFVSFLYYYLREARAKPESN